MTPIEKLSHIRNQVLILIVSLYYLFDVKRDFVWESSKPLADIRLGIPVTIVADKRNSLHISAGTVKLCRPFKNHIQ